MTTATLSRRQTILRADTPPAHDMDVECIAPTLIGIARWVHWKWSRNDKGKWGKIPCNARGIPCGAHDSANWHDFATAERIAASKGFGIGFVFNGDGIAGIDLDDCRDPETGKIKGWAEDIIDLVATYTEVSPSGTGVKLFVRGELPERFDKEYGRPDGDGEVEIYATGRFFTVTGQRVHGTPDDVQERPAQLLTVLKLFQSWKREKTSVVKLVSPKSDEPIRTGDDDRATALAALAVLDPSMHHGQWIKTGMALHSVDSSATMLGEWDRWSKGSTVKYSDGDCATRWASFNGDGVGIGTLCHIADATGTQWRPVRDFSTKGVNLPKKAIIEDSDKPETHLPTVVLPGGSMTITEAAMRFGTLLAETGHTYRRGDSVSELSHDQAGKPILSIVKPARLASSLESVAKLVAIKNNKDGFEEVSTTCSETTARLIQNAGEFLARLPPIKVLSPCPVLVERNGQLVQIVGYDRLAEVLAAGEPPPYMSLDEARELLNEITSDFCYTSPADRSRHLASIITPALVLGDLLGGRAPVDLTEANESQSGKGFKNKITSAIYGMKLKTITQRKSGVGGIEESFSSALVSGAAFIALDNLRDKVDLPSLESFLTEDTFQARVPYSGDVEIDARRIIVMATSNKAEITPDLANRSSIVRILKQTDGYQFRQFSEGNILDHVLANQPLYLGAVFAVVRAWHFAGKLRTTETGHDFRRWATTLDWIVQYLLLCPPLLGGHRAAQTRMATPALTWLRDVALAVVRVGRTGQWLRTHEILDVAEAAGLDVPGATEDTNLEDEACRVKVLRAIGKRLGGCFRDDKATIDGVMIQRQHTPDHESRLRSEYQFTLATTPEENAYSPNPPNSPRMYPE